jgi:hypothetical protein
MASAAVASLGSGVPSPQVASSPLVVTAKVITSPLPGADLPEIVA